MNATTCIPNQTHDDRRPGSRRATTGRRRRRLGPTGPGLGLPLRALRHRRHPRHLRPPRRRSRARTLLDVACGSGLAVRLADADRADDRRHRRRRTARRRRPRSHPGRRPAGRRHVRPALGRRVVRRRHRRSTGSGVAARQRWPRPTGCSDPADRSPISFWGRGPPRPATVLQGLRRQRAGGARRRHEAHQRDRPPRCGGGDARSGRLRDRSIGTDAISTLEWPDEETAWRALSSVGPAVPALEAVGPEVAAAAGRRGDRARCGTPGIYRFRNDQQFVIARRP